MQFFWGKTRFSDTPVLRKTCRIITTSLSSVAGMVIGRGNYPQWCPDTSGRWMIFSSTGIRFRHFGGIQSAGFSWSNGSNDLEALGAMMAVMAGTSLPWHMAFSLMAEMEVSADGCGQGTWRTWRTWRDQNWRPGLQIMDYGSWVNYECLATWDARLDMFRLHIDYI